MKTKLFSLIFGIYLFIVSLVYYLLSIEIYKDTDGTSIEFNQDYVYLIATGVIVIVLAILSIRNRLSNKNKLIGLSLIGLVNFVGPFQEAMKLLVRNKMAGNISFFADHMVWSGFGLLLIAYCIYFCFEDRKKAKV